jgi:hypothetical protein
MRTLAVLLVLGVAGCASSGPNLSTIMQTCGYSEKPFTSAWPCVRQGVAQADAPGDLKDVYVASGDFVAEQITTGKMTDAEAKLAMAQVRQKAKEAQDTRSQIPVGNAIVAASILNRQPGAQSTPMYGYPSAPMNCYRVGSNVQCY